MSISLPTSEQSDFIITSASAKRATAISYHFYVRFLDTKWIPVILNKNKGDHLFRELKYMDIRNFFGSSSAKANKKVDADEETRVD